MKQSRVFKVRILPTAEQRRRLLGYEEGCHFIINRSLAWQREKKQSGQKAPDWEDLSKVFNVWVHATQGDYLDEIPISLLRHALKESIRIFANSPKGLVARYRPRLIFSEPDDIKMDSDGRRLLLPGLGWVRYRKSHKIVGHLRGAIVKRGARKWLVQIQVECAKSYSRIARVSPVAAIRFRRATR